MGMQFYRVVGPNILFNSCVLERWAAILYFMLKSGWCRYWQADVFFFLFLPVGRREVGCISCLLEHSASACTADFGFFFFNYYVSNVQPKSWVPYRHLRGITL